jgi:hypothetical protein
MYDLQPPIRSFDFTIYIAAIMPACPLFRKGCKGKNNNQGTRNVAIRKNLL